MRNLPPLSALRAFEAAARRGNLSQAAEELYVTHGAVSKQVKALEQALGVVLTRRTGRGIELTPEGRRFIPTLTKAFDDLDVAVRSLGSETAAGELLVSCMPALAATWLIPRLSTFFELYPEISLTILSANQSTERRPDIEILYGRPEWPDRKIELLKQLEVFPVCSPRIMNGPEPVRRLDDLFKHLLIDEPSGAHWRDFFVAHGRDPSGVRHMLRLQDFSHEIAAARAGLGIAMGDKLTMAGDLAAGQLVRPLPAMIKRQSLGYYLVTAADAPRSAAMKAFIDWVISEIQKLDRD